jgi:aldose sugar dehydrogenase
MTVSTTVSILPTSVLDAVLFATGFAGISDIEVSPYDEYMYVVSLGQGKIFKIVPTGEADTTSGTIPPPTVTVPPVTDGEDEGGAEEQDLSEQDDVDENDESDGEDQNENEDE